MGIKIANWQETFISNLSAAGFDVEINSADSFLLIDFKKYGNLVINLISVNHNFGSAQAIHLQEYYREQNIQLVQLWEDVWLTRPLQVISRICSMLGVNRKVHGRKTNIINITQPQADQFLDNFHLQGRAKARYHYALEADGLMVAVASFSGKRKMTRKHADYTSVELIRFANAEGITVQGGLSKLIKHLIKAITPNDIMTYADMDWSYGKGYAKLGFELSAQTSACEIWLDQRSLIRYFPHRLPVEVIDVLGAEIDSSTEVAAKMRSLHYARVFNTGNLKYILYL